VIVPASLDTNMLLRLTLRDIPEQYETVKSLVTAPGARYYVADMAVVEMVHALMHHYGFSRAQVSEVVRAIISDSALETNAVLLESAVACFVAHVSLSFVDCYLAEQARECGNTPLLTFDKKLTSQHVAAQLAR